MNGFSIFGNGNKKDEKAADGSKVAEAAGVDNSKSMGQAPGLVGGGSPGPEGFNFKDAQAMPSVEKEHSLEIYPADATAKVDSLKDNVKTETVKMTRMLKKSGELNEAMLLLEKEVGTLSGIVTLLISDLSLVCNGNDRAISTRDKNGFVNDRSDYDSPLVKDYADKIDFVRSLEFKVGAVSMALEELRGRLDIR